MAAEKEDFAGVHMDEDIETTKEVCIATLESLANPLLIPL
jgi:hypothetical protein